MFRLLPKEDKYFDQFNRLASNIHGSAQLLQKLFNDFGNRAAYADQIKQLEHTCDEITHGIIKQLNLTFITPFDREDIHALASQLDDVIDGIEYVSRRVILYRLTAPTNDAVKMIDVLVRLTASLEKAVGSLEKDGEGLLKECAGIHTLESEGDTYHHDAVDRLFSTETDPIQILKLKELYEKLERAIDKCEDAANVLESITLKNA
ncbi:MAG: DUF47 domain-containing protein [Acidobacteria bacterium]|nr:DUF47 domain-containing protein [Acidobacteriota bacterium]